jgi:OmcA/MtrC family decaheme c-type cytochrome
MTYLRTQARWFLIGLVALLALLSCLACQGKQGDDGAVGARGLAGDDGIRGPQGESGDSGTPGPSGPSGPIGPGGDGSETNLSEYGDIIVTIGSAVVPTDLRPEVTFTLRNRQNQPLRLSDLEQEGDVALNFTIARLVSQPAYSEYISYIVMPQEQYDGATILQPTFENDGNLTELESGSYSYKFRTLLPADYDQNATHTIGISISRTLSEQLFTANASYDFLPAGAAVNETKDITSSETCNACHIPALHHHQRQDYDTALCVLCHTSQATDLASGRTLDFDRLIHNIHMGRNLQSVQGGEAYELTSADGTRHDYSNILYPQDIRQCESCHSGQDKDLWTEQPNRLSCSACHDLVDFVNETNPFFHSGGVQLDDKQCAYCHPAVSNNTFSGLTENHQLPLRNRQIDPPLAGLNFIVSAVENLGGGQKPLITFKVTDANGQVLPLDALSYLEINVAGPTSGYAWRLYYDQVISNARAEGEQYVVMIPEPLPSFLSGTLAVALSGFRCVPYSEIECSPDYREQGVAPIFYASVTGGEPELPAQSIDMAKCRSCHQNLPVHGNTQGMMFDVALCQFCHTASATDVNTRLSGLPESIDLTVMGHKIHRGIDLAKPYIIYNHQSEPIDYSTSPYPTDLARCSTCHDPNLTPPNSTLVCTSCHDSAEAIGHALINTTPEGVETCDVCHGPGRAFDSRDMHPQD